MTPKEALQVMESLINAAIQKGLFSDAKTVIHVNEALAALASIVENS